ncbi:MAG: hypothetical protein HY319_13875 [Armatimonadetes bacterium]|nr:hypothetical protein [Armatimonadota bacterium]
MPILCPKCNGEVHFRGERQAVCSRHGGKFQVLYAAPHARLAASPETPTVSGIPCARHSQSAAVHRCKKCARGVCPVCDFFFGAGAHLCPECVVETPTSGLTERRRGALRLSYILAAVSTICLVMTVASFAAAFANGDAMALFLGFLFIVYGVVATSTVGFFVALETVDKYEGNPFQVWGSVAWNGLIFITCVGAPVGLLIFGSLGFFG